jgi:protein-S-isoprenylcysteine O-methyltransferase Ste14
MAAADAGADQVAPETTDADTPGVIAPPPLIYAGPLVAGLLFQRVWPRRALPAPLARLLGVVLLPLGLALVGWAALTMRQAGTNIRPDRPATALVTWGPFRVSRNPGYLAMTLLYLGIALWRNALWPLVALPGVLAVITRGVIEREERYLERRFGDAYVHYRTRVRRWL